MDHQNKQRFNTVLDEISGLMNSLWWHEKISFTLICVFTISGVIFLLTMVAMLVNGISNPELTQMQVFLMWVKPLGISATVMIFLQPVISEHQLLWKRRINRMNLLILEAQAIQEAWKD